MPMKNNNKPPHLMSYFPDTESLTNDRIEHHQDKPRTRRASRCSSGTNLFEIFQAAEDMHAGKWQDLPPDIQSCRGWEVLLDRTEEEAVHICGGGGLCDVALPCISKMWSMGIGDVGTNDNLKYGWSMLRFWIM